MIETRAPGKLFVAGEYAVVEPGGSAIAVAVDRFVTVRATDAAINEFRAQVRTDLRSHVARGGELAASVIDDVVKRLDDIARDITRTLRG